MGQTWISRMGTARVEIEAKAMKPLGKYSFTEKRRDIEFVKDI